MENVVIAIQNAPASVWIREAFWPFPVILAVHIAGMALAAGTSVITSARIIGLAPSVPLVQMARFRPVVWLGVTLAVISGIALFMSYPAKAITNPPFFPKLAIFIAVLILGAVMRRKVLLNPAYAGGVPASWKLTAGLVALGWLLVIAAGRILAYTYSSNDLLWYPAGAF